MQILGPRKRRTRQHVIADLSVHYLEGFVLAEGHTTQRLTSDYGYDLVMFTYDEQGYLEPGLVFFQLKATENLDRRGGSFVYDLDVRDYNVWIREKIPVVLVLFDATRNLAYWGCVQSYFRANPDRAPKAGAKRVRISIPNRQPLTRSAIARIRDLKSETYFRAEGIQT